MFKPPSHRLARSLTVLAALAAIVSALALPGSASARTSTCGFWDSCAVGGSLTISLAPPQTTNGFVNALQVASGQAQVQAYIGTALCQNMGMAQNIASVIWQESTDGGQTWVTILETAIGGGPLSLGLLPDGQKTDIRAELTYANLGGYGFRGCPHGTVLATSNSVGPIVYDATPPTTSLIVPALPVSNAGPVTFQLNAQDATSGVAYTEWRTAESGVIQKGTALTLPAGTGRNGATTVYFHSADVAGNVAAWSEARIWVKNGMTICDPVTPGICTPTDPAPAPGSDCPTGDVCSSVPSTAPGAPSTGYVGIPAPATSTAPAANEPPVAIAYISAERGGTAVLDGRQSFDPDGYVAKWHWVLGGKTIGTAPVLTHRFPAGAKTYKVKLTVSDNGTPPLSGSTNVAVTVSRAGTVTAPKTIKVSLSSDVLFDWDRFVLRPGAARVLATLKAQVVGAKSVTIEGYTDSTGPVAYNVTLSHERADAVAKVLRTSGVKTVEHWYGESRPLPGAKCVDLTSTWRPCQLNRRVTIEIVRR